jgi:hypothetical protein
MIFSDTPTFTPTATATSTPALLYFDIAGNSSVNAGSVFYVTVTARTYGGAVMNSYDGLAWFDTTSILSALPADYAYQIADAGARIFPVQLMTAGDQYVSVYDTDNMAAQGELPITVNPGAASYFVMSVPSSVKAGNSFFVTVTARDIYNNFVVIYTGAVHFSSTDAAASLPSDYTFIRDDSGSKIFSVTLKTKGSHTISAYDMILNTINGSSSAVQVLSGDVSRFSVNAPSLVNAGSSFNFAVSALDAYNNIVDWYGGKVAFTSTDGSASLPADYTFLAGDYGSRVFTATLNNTPGQTINTVSRSFSHRTCHSRICTSLCMSLYQNRQIPLYRLTLIWNMTYICRSIMFLFTPVLIFPELFSAT